jgi:hypothetical protein
MEIQTDAMSWAQTMFGDCKLADKRLTRRLVHTMGHLARQGGGSINRACAKDAAAAQGGYRLLRNTQMDIHAMNEAGFAATARRIQAQHRILAIEDSSELSYSHTVAQELGDTGGKQSKITSGLWAHNTLMVDAENAMTLGLIAQTLWSRDKQQRGKSRDRRHKSPEDKESGKWSEHARQMRQRLGAHMPQVISVSDRESDVFTYLWDKSAHGERFIVRAAQDRALRESDARLFETLRGHCPCGVMQIDVPQRGGRKGRSVHLSLRAQAVKLAAPRRQGIDPQASVAVNVVLAQEEGTAADSRLCWILLSSEPIETVEQIKEILKFYALRWRIEEFHKAWKSGAQVEHMRMQSRQSLERMIVMLAFIAVRLLQLREVLDQPQAKDKACTEVLSEQEWKVLWVSSTGKADLPSRVPTLGWAYEAVARLGHFTDSKHTGRASWAAMYEGWKRLQDHVALLSVVGAFHE